MTLSTAEISHRQTQGSIAKLHVRPLIFADAIHQVDDQLIKQLITRSADEFAALTKRTKLTPIDYFRGHGFATFRQLSLFPNQSIIDVTQRWFHKIGKSLATPSRHSFENLINQFWLSFTELTVDLPQKAIDKSLSKNAAGMLAYGLYQQDRNRSYALKNASLFDGATLIQLRKRLKQHEQYVRELVHFLLYEKWFQDHSLIDILTYYWQRDFGFYNVEVDVTALGFPDGYYKPSNSNNELALVTALNLEGEKFLSHHSAIKIINQLADAVVSTDISLGAQNNNVRIISWNRLKDFWLLRAKPKVMIDAGLQPLALVEILAHELTHHVFHQLDKTNCFVCRDAVCWLNQPVINEGFAEFHTKNALAKVFDRYPELNYYRLLRRAIHHQEQPDDPHLSGAALFEEGNITNLPSALEKFKTSKEVKTVTYQDWHATPGFNLAIHSNDKAPKLVIEKITIADCEWFAKTIEKITR